MFEVLRTMCEYLVNLTTSTHAKNNLYFWASLKPGEKRLGRLEYYFTKLQIVVNDMFVLGVPRF